MNNTSPIRKYEKPKVLAESKVLMADCRPISVPSGRPCNPPAPMDITADRRKGGSR